MRSYSIQLEGSDKSFTYITDESPENIADAVFERFRVIPVKIVQL